jgi:hypothetical protein
VAQIFKNGQTSQNGSRKNFKVIMSMSKLALETISSVAYILAATINHEKEVQALKYRMN